MKEIKLTQGKITLVDDIDFINLSKYNWYAASSGNTFYAIGWVKGRRIKMHRFLMNVTDSKNLVDHEDRDGLNNQKYNLRVCTKAQNNANRVSKNGSTSKYLGVYFDKQLQQFRTRIRKDKKLFHLGTFDNEEVAAIAYNKAAMQLHGKFANLNKVYL